MFKDILIPYVNEDSLEAPLRAAVALAEPDEEPPLMRPGARGLGGVP